ncbi:MAG: hypothetical protein WCC26_16510 [Terracidiphilus sp.]
MRWTGKIVLIAVSAVGMASAQTVGNPASATLVLWDPPRIDWPDSLSRSLFSR